MYLNTFVNTFYIIFKISSLFIQSIINLKMNVILGIKLYSSSVNDITDMYVIYYITCW